MFPFHSRFKISHKLLLFFSVRSSKFRSNEKSSVSKFQLDDIRRENSSMFAENSLCWQNVSALPWHNSFRELALSVLIPIAKLNEFRELREFVKSFPV